MKHDQKIYGHQTSGSFATTRKYDEVAAGPLVGDLSRRISTMIRASNNTDGPEFKDQVRGAAVSVLPLHPAVAMEETQPPPPSLPVPDEGPSFKDQARDARPSAVIGREIPPHSAPLSQIALTNGGPDYKDQAQHCPMEPNHCQISDVTAGDSRPPATVIPAVWSAPTLADAELVSAHLVPESVAPDPDPPVVLLTAQVVDMEIEKRRIVFKASLIILGVLLLILVPTFVLTLRGSNNSSSKSEATPPVTPPSYWFLTNETAPPIPTATPSISRSPSAAPTMLHRYIPIGEPIVTDLFDVQRSMASLSSNGTVVALANNDNIQVYRQNVSSISAAVTWVPLGSAVPAKAEIASVYDKNFTMYLAPDALVLVVGIPSFQSSAGRVDVYDYDRSSDQWVTRGESFIGNSTDQLGYDVALSTDGNIVSMAASNYSSGVSYASVWSWNSTSETWIFFGKINGFSGAPSLSIAVSDLQGDYQGPRIILGDPGDGIVGKAEVHECTDSDGCSLLDVELKGPDYEDFFGYDVSISRNGDFIAIGSPGIPECREVCANVKVYEFGRGTESVWTLVGQEIMGMIGFGEKVKISQDGVTLAVYFYGGPFANTSFTQLYQLQIGVWTTVGAPLYNAEFMDMSYDGNVVATTSNGEVVLQSPISYDVSNSFG